MFNPVVPADQIVQQEVATIDFWETSHIFEKSLELSKEKKRFVFFEGPPTANGMPGVHHGLARVFKDTILRYKAGSGYYVPRKGGWDCQGLPVEIEVEKRLQISGKQQIEEYGVEAFVRECRNSVFTYKAEWEKMTSRIGFWLDTEHAYATYTNDYIESVWNILKRFYDQGLLYQGHKVVPYCPRCGTALSMHEVAQGYKNVSEETVFVKFTLTSGELAGTRALVWTTTPWTLPSNVALAVNPDVDYLVVELEGERYLLAEARLSAVFGHDAEHVTVVRKYRGKELAGTRYERLYDYANVSPEEMERGWRIVTADYVTTTDGTGIVHIAPAFGEDDLSVGLKEGLPFVQLVDLAGKFTPEVKPWAGKDAKGSDPDIRRQLKADGKLFKTERIEHDYPFCWRCDTPLLYYAKDSWFVRTTAFKDRMIANNQQITWYPEHIKDGRFGNWLENIKDWALSRERYWGTPLPIWKCDSCGHQHAVGSIAELNEMAINPDPQVELHRPYVDKIELRCPECGGVMHRVPEVIDVWFDSGSMPYAQWHYPFENQGEFAKMYPADFISEGIDQTRGWFYTLHAISTALYDQPAFKNCMVLELVLDEKGHKMSKHVGNVIDPWSILDKQGADAFRWSLYTSTPPWYPRRFGPNVVADALKNFIIPLRNVYSFFVLYANIDHFDPDEPQVPVEQRSELDRWLLSRFQALVRDVRENMEAYEINPATKLIQAFVEELSNWYVRLSRRRFWKSENDADKLAAYQTLYTVLVDLARLLTPFTPFMSEEIYQNLVRSVKSDAELSVHFLDLPEFDESRYDERLSASMQAVMDVVSLGRSARKQAGVKTRQPLQAVAVYVRDEQIHEALVSHADIVRDELNVKSITEVMHASDIAEFTLRPNLPVLGKRAGRSIPLIQKALTVDAERLHAELETAGQVSLDLEGVPFILTRDDVISTVSGKGGMFAASAANVVVAIDPVITPELRGEWYVREVEHFVQGQRKESGYQVTDRVRLAVTCSDAEVASVLTAAMHEIAQEVLAREVLVTQGPVEGDEPVLELDGSKIACRLEL
ncbi:MAG: isoleucine--tRNA ligase [Candidatus Cryosericum sp.]